MHFFNFKNKIFTYKNKIFPDTTSFKLNSISGLLLWYKFDKKYLSINNNKVSSVQDLSGNFNIAFQNNINNQPSYISNYLNGYDIIQLNNQQLLSNIYLDYFTIFSIFNISSGNNGYIYEFNNTNADTGFFITGSNNSVGITKNGLANSSIKSYYPGWSSTATWKIVSQVYGGTHSSNKLYVNSQSAGLITYFSYNKNPGALNKSGTLSIGSRYNNTNGVNCKLAEYIIYNRVLSDTERIKVQNYLNNKYEIY